MASATVARSPSNPQLVLRPRDLVVLLRLALDSGPAPTYAALGAELAIKDGAGKPARFALP